MSVGAPLGVGALGPGIRHNLQIFRTFDGASGFPLKPGKWKGGWGQWEGRRSTLSFQTYAPNVFLSGKGTGILLVCGRASRGEAMWIWSYCAVGIRLSKEMTQREPQRPRRERKGHKKGLKSGKDSKGSPNGP
eukprot:1374880-Amorphochlora_amoeboformis.AAC.1